MKKKTEKRLVVIKSSGVLPELNYITGPVLYPYYLDVDTIGRLISNGRLVYEVNPENKEDEVKLTLKNLKTSNFVQGEVKATGDIPPQVTSEIGGNQKAAQKTQYNQNQPKQQVEKKEAAQSNQSTQSAQKPITSDFTDKKTNK